MIGFQDIITKLANKLQRQLLAKQNRAWDFDLEEGLLDSSKLPRIIIDPYNSLSFKTLSDLLKAFKKLDNDKFTKVIILVVQLHVTLMHL